MEIRPGATAEVALTVTPDRTADVLGNRGVTVLATPFLVGLLEQAAGALIHPHLPPGASTVGTMVEMRHLAPTPVGMTVRARATLLETDGRRYLFAVEAWDEREKVAEGRHERFVIPSLAKFLERATQKIGAAAPPHPPPVRPGPAPREAH
ncbi:MAG: thioesterase [Candidatus Rokuibacteriota bacterium]|nr:MAG: thioesterase [Candidatus Rokubacteria bacterium]PYN09578.1 MAG: thioesterase [Candidatus Rokubacteria bacterium]